MSCTPFSVVRPWNSQYGNPDEGICTPHCVTLPEASRLVSFCANADISAQVAGGLFGSRPASLNASLFQYRTMVERWNGMPHVLPPVWLFFMKAGKNDLSHASSSMSVNMSVERRMAVVGGSPLLLAVSPFTIVSW